MRVKEFCKQSLPPKWTFKLRSMKARYADPDTIVLLELARKFGGANAAAVDVGANVGIYSGLLSRIFGDVISIEPHPACQSYLRRVLPSNCRLVEAAASDSEGTAVLRVPKSIDGFAQTTRSTVSEANDLDGLAPQNIVEVRVPTSTVDKIVDEYGAGLPITLLKIDVEGHEFAVLRGAARTLSRHKPALFIELEERHGVKPTEVLLWLHEIGYDVFSLQGADFVPVERFSAENLRRSSCGETSWNYVLFPRTETSSKRT
jgi:FkbM family methyltransferase